MPKKADCCPVFKVVVGLPWHDFLASMEQFNISVSFNTFFLYVLAAANVA